LNPRSPSVNPKPRRGLSALAARVASMSRRTRILLAVGLPVLLVVAGSAWGVHHHVQAGPGFCFGACHAGPSHAGMSLSEGHQGVPCDGCHELRFWLNARQWWAGKTRGKDAHEPHAQVTDARCKACHSSGSGSKLQIAGTVSHAAHDKQNVGCASCHGSKTHDLSPRAERCQTCHAGEQMHEAGMKDLPCLSCHDFLARGSKLAKAPSTECRTCHGGKPSGDRSSRFALVVPARDVSTTMIHGNIFACSLCHQPHKEKLDERRTGRDCARCHARAPQGASSIAVPAHSACGTCHKVHSPRSELSGACAKCHQMARPEALAGTTAGKHPACSTCHAAHEFAASRADCVQCHAGQSPLAKVERMKPHTECGNCHAPHRPAVEKDACLTCHAEKKAHGHESCVTCHDPHQDKSSTRSCASCHGAQRLALVSGKGGHTGGCQTCHAPHTAGGASMRCAGCHSEQGSKVAAAGVTPHSQCASCHRPHEFSPATAASACAGCHKIDTAGAHKGPCRSCHQPHGSPRIGADACIKCHGSIPKASAGKHAECRSCHQPHQPASGGSLQCANCHAGQVAAARSWPAAQHQACPGCHQQHNPSQKTPCAQCHAKEASSVSGTKHQCSACHSPHQAPGDWWARCVSCHAGQAAASQGRGATHARCESCHKPHKFSKPSCTACHNAMGRLGAHAHSGHAGCLSCHDSHGKSTPSRATCLACHKDKTDHNPNAKSCTSCHLFK
jgi:hypothetical protein